MEERFPYIIGPRSSIAFDATWLLALSLNESLEDAMRMQNTTNNNEYLELADKLRERMKTRDFEGISVGKQSCRIVVICMAVSVLMFRILY